MKLDLSLALKIDALLVELLFEVILVRGRLVKRKIEVEVGKLG